MKRRGALLVAILSAAALSACAATGGGSSPDADARLMLDFQPNAVHSGIYVATSRGYDEALGVNLNVEVPGDGTDAIGLLLSNRIQFAVLDIHDLALAREKGRNLVAVMALVQRPLAAVLAAPSVRSPRALTGARVGVTGLPSDDAVLDSIFTGAGGDPAKVKRTTIGFNAVGALLSGKVDAATAFWNVEGVALKQKRPRIQEFRVDDFGAPRYPELVLAARPETIQDTPELVQAAVTALRRGYREVMLGPEEAVGVMVDRVDGLKRKTVQAELDAVLPAFVAGGLAFGRFDLPSLEKWSAWEQRFGITKKQPDVTRMFNPSFAKKGKISG